MAKAMVRRVRPKAKDTPKNPIPMFGKAAANTALPQPQDQPERSDKLGYQASDHFFLLSFMIRLYKSTLNTYIAD
jgi:hypothetical protein